MPISYRVRRWCCWLQLSGWLLHQLKFQRLIQKLLLDKSSRGKLGIEVRYVASQKYWGRYTKVNDNLVGDSSNDYSIEADHKASVVLTKMSKSSYLPWTECALLCVGESQISYFLPVKNFFWAGLCFASWLCNLDSRGSQSSGKRRQTNNQSSICHENS